MGGAVAAMASGRRFGNALAAGERFTAAVGVYPPCYTIRPPSAPPYDLVGADIDRPYLALLGGEDTETPPAECMPKLEAAKAAGGPVEWEVYPKATHCWDCRHLDGFTKTDARGNAVRYQHDGNVTQASMKRMFEFLDKQGR